MKSIIRAVMLTVCLLALTLSIFAADAQTLYNSEYCFSRSDFSGSGTDTLNGIFVASVPEDSVAVIMLGNRAVRAGDILSAASLDTLRLLPTCKQNCVAVLSYQPICGTALGKRTEVSVSIRSGKNEAPKANPQEFETYKNIPNDGTLTGTDPENAALTFELVEKPKHGTVKLEANGSYVYTPDKNRVGEDSFTYTVTDEAGNVSQPATVRIRILKPSDSMSFADMEGSLDCFEAMWLSESGLSGGRSIVGTNCFCPEDNVSRAEFLLMAMKLRNVPVNEKLTVSGFTDAPDAPAWVQPYLATAMQRGIVCGEARPEGLMFRPNDPITGQEAAVMLQNLLQLPVPVSKLESDGAAWAAVSLQALNEVGITLSNPLQPLTRLNTAKLLWQISQLS